MTGRAVVLIGPMGAGKTSIGRKTAKALHVSFFDTDIAVSRAHGPIPEIFASEGEAQFREWERAAVIEALRTDGVVALGGGAILDADTRADLRRHPVVLLTVDPRTVAGRLQSTTRPLLQGDDALQRWKAVAAERGQLYDDLADVSFDTATGHIRDIVARVAEWVRAQWAAQDAAAVESESEAP
ncbi:shikimate kinase [Microbacterium terrisoli]|jgi:shikimate kinase|uniref:shikimate kinase n=1 Tax=Microbacterium terrisoli TaxID=3242192 RepID=UPI0028058C73|nr:shikimate kinase [Microbacterium protaetiae]